MPFRLAIVVSSNPIHINNAHSLHQKLARNTMGIEKVKWISAHSCMWQAKMTFIHAKFKLKRKHLGPRHCLTKCAPTVHQNS